MPLYQPCFFSQHKTSSSVHGVEFYQTVSTPKEVRELYRGFHHVSGVMFNLSTMIFGLFGHTLPQRVSMTEIKLHKVSNLSNDAHMLGMSSDEAVAKDWGRNEYITVDPSLIRPFLVDVHATYSRHLYTFPARMLREKEHVGLAVLSCNVKTITLGEEVIVNPFYINRNDAVEEIRDAYSTLYLDYLCLLRAIPEKKADRESLKELITVFVEGLLAFYETYSGDKNPFDKSISNLSETHPLFMSHFLKHQTIEDQSITMKDLVFSNLEGLLLDHPHIETILNPKTVKEADIVTVYDDPYSYSQYD